MHSPSCNLFGGGFKAVALVFLTLLPPFAGAAHAAEGPKKPLEQSRVTNTTADTDVLRAVHEAHDATQAAHEAAQAAHEAAEAARAAAEAAHATAQAVHDVASHVEALEHAEPKNGPVLPEWGYQLALDALANTGNSSTFSSNLSGGVDGNWHDWSLELRLSAAYGATDPPGRTPNEVTAFNGSLSARGERHFNPIMGIFGLGGATTDHVANIRYQAYGDTGMVLIWWETERDSYVKSRLRTSVGLRVLHESRHQYFVDNAQNLGSRLVYGPLINMSFRYALTKTTYFNEDLEFLYNVAESEDMRLNSSSTLVAKVTDRVDLRLGARVRYIGSPAVGKRRTDTSLTAGLGFTF